jgi:hypothetical protein
LDCRSGGCRDRRRCRDCSSAERLDTRPEPAVAAGCGRECAARDDACGCACETGDAETIQAARPPEAEASDADQVSADLFGGECGICHTLAAVGTTGRVGPNLDDMKPTKDACSPRSETAVEGPV